MNDNLEQQVARRTILQRGACGALGLAGLTSQMFTMRTTAAMLDGLGFGDYKALVCVFLYGGNDSGNTLVPIDGGEQNYDSYANVRAQLALGRSEFNNTIITPSNTAGRRFGLHPSMTRLKSLFDQGDMSMVANVGSLLYPMDRESFYNNTVARPRSLFAHDVQQLQWQISTADAADRLGWGGRVADALQSAGANPSGNISMNISLAGTNFYQNGNSVSPFVMGRNGAPEIQFNGVASNSAGRELLEIAYADLMAVQCDPNYPSPNTMQKIYADINANTLVENELVSQLLDNTELNTAAPETNLGRQLELTARMIQQRSALSHERQIFFCAIGGFDNHNGLVGTNGLHGNLMRELDDGLGYFWDVLGELNARDMVTTFTASDFGRTMTSNDNGSDHGWGGHHFVMGGAQVRGGRLFGRYPNLDIEGPDDTTRGRYIPTTAVDEFSFEMAKWLGVPLSEMTTVFPNLNRFLDPNNPATHLGILV